MGAAMGFTPAEVEAMTLAEFYAAVDGWNRVHGAGSKQEAPSDDRFEEMKQMMGDS